MWKVTITEDLDKNSIGTVSATYTDKEGISFTYSDRMKVELDSMDKFSSSDFAARANKALADVKAKAEGKLKRELAIEEYLNKEIA